MRIYLPNSAFLGNFDQFLRTFDSSDPERLLIAANDRWISIHPAALTMVAALGLKVRNKRNISSEKFVARSAHYLDRMKLFDFLGLESDASLNIHEPAGRFVPLTQIKTSSEQTQFIKEMVPLLHLGPEYADPIKYIISELIRNVIEHSSSKDGAIIAAQYYKSSNTIRIGISDTGVGIKTTIGKSYRVEDDLSALHLALMPGVTGTTRREGGTEENAGAGLFFIKSIAYTNRDFFMLYSGNAMYKLLKRDLSEPIYLRADPKEDKHSESGDFPYWQGTVVGIDMVLDNNETFSSLLDMIRNTYSRAIKERRKARYRQPKFI